MADSCGFDGLPDAVGDEAGCTLPFVEGKECIEGFSAEGVFGVGDFHIAASPGESGDLMESVKTEGAVDSDHFGLILSVGG